MAFESNFSGNLDSSGGVASVPLVASIAMQKTRAPANNRTPHQRRKAGNALSRWFLISLSHGHGI